MKCVICEKEIKNKGRLIRSRNKGIISDSLWYLKQMNLLKGKLTFILAGLSVLYAIVGLCLGWINSETALGIAWAGLAVFGLRRAINE